MTPLPYQPISYLEWNAARRGSSAAIWEGGAEITFEELLGHVRRIQKLLAAAKKLSPVDGLRPWT